VQENKLSYSSASNMMAVKQKMKSANAKNAMKVEAPVLAAARHLAPRGFMKVDGYVRQEEAQDEFVNVQAYGWRQ
jgi:hypothetical protein